MTDHMIPRPPGQASPNNESSPTATSPGAQKRRRRLSVTENGEGFDHSEHLVAPNDTPPRPAPEGLFAPDKGDLQQTLTSKQGAVNVNRDAIGLPHSGQRGESAASAAPICTGKPPLPGGTPAAPPVVKKPARGRRLSVSGRMPAELDAENMYQPKQVAIKHDQGVQGNLKCSLTSMGIGYACHKGLKPEAPNQDDFFIIRIDEWGLYGVFDGHGPFGHDVSNFVQREFPKQLYSKDFLEAEPGPDKIEKVMKDAFENVQQKLIRYCNMPGVRTCASLSGSTASIVYHRIQETLEAPKGRLICAHVGDSRVVIGRRDKVTGQIKAIDLAQDHKPECPDEKDRIEANGGEVRKIPGDVPHRVFLKNKLFPGLAMSRALGDLVGVKAGVISEPDVTDYTINGDDEFLILASDGVWEFIESQECCDMIATDLKKGDKFEISQTVEEICSKAWRRWKEEEGNVVDDITLEIIMLNGTASKD